jgi:hypothetical protein
LARLLVTQVVTAFAAAAVGADGWPTDVIAVSSSRINQNVLCNPASSTLCRKALRQSGRQMLPVHTNKIDALSAISIDNLPGSSQLKFSTGSSGNATWL